MRKSAQRRDSLAMSHLTFSLRVICRMVLALPLIGWCLGCSAGPGEATASVTVALSAVPDDVACVRITAVGSSRTATALRPVAPGHDESFNLNGLPLGFVTFTGEAFSTVCALVSDSSLATWVSDPVQATIGVAANTPVSLLLRRNGRASVSVGFDDPGDEDGALAYVTDQGCKGSIHLIDVGSDMFVGEIALSKPEEGSYIYPYEIVFSPNGMVAYVSAMHMNSTFDYDGELLIIDRATKSLIRRVQLDGGPVGVVVSPGGESVYVTLDGPQDLLTGQRSPGHVVTFDVATQSVVRTVTVGPVPRGLALSPDGRQLYLTSPFESSLSVIDVASWAVVKTIPVSVYEPGSIAFSLDGTVAYVVGYPHMQGAPSVVAVVDVASGSEVGHIPFDGSAQKVILSPDGLRLYVTYDVADPSMSGTPFIGHVGTIDIAAGALVADVLLPNPPLGLALGGGTKLYVANSNAVSVIDTVTNQLKTNIFLDRLCASGIAIK